MEKFQKNIGFEAFKYDVDTAFGKIPLRVKAGRSENIYKMHVELNVPTFIDPVWAFDMVMGNAGEEHSELVEELNIMDLLEYYADTIKFNLLFFLLNTYWVDGSLFDEIINMATYRHHISADKAKEAYNECVEILKILKV